MEAESDVVVEVELVGSDSPKVKIVVTTSVTSASGGEGRVISSAARYWFTLREEVADGKAVTSGKTVD